MEPGAGMSAIKKSTTVRSFLLTVRTAIATLSRCAPALAARLAEILFLRPPRAPRPAWEQALLPAGEPTWIVSGRHRLPVWSWGRGPAVLLVHGWGGRGSQLGALAAPLMAAGYRVVTFDAPGHGGTGTRRSSLPEMAAAVADVARHAGGAVAVVAHSFGAAAVNVALRDGLTVQRLAYLAPPADLAALSTQWLARAGFTAAVVDRMRRRLERRFAFWWHDVEGLSIAPAMDRPLLVIHDQHDREVPVVHGASLASAWRGARLRTTSGLGHHRILRDAGVRAAIAEFLGPATARPGALRMPPASVPRLAARA